MTPSPSVSISIKAYLAFFEIISSDGLVPERAVKLELKFLKISLNSLNSHTPLPSVSTCEKILSTRDLTCF